MDFFGSQTGPSQLVVDEAWGTGGQSFVFASVNLATIALMLLCVGPQAVFLAAPCKNPVSTGNTEIKCWPKVLRLETRSPRPQRSAPAATSLKDKGDKPMGKLPGPCGFECILACTWCMHNGGRLGKQKYVDDE